MSIQSSSTATEKDFVITRLINAPRQAVFKAWTDPIQFKQWWGPETFTNPICEIDLRKGGNFRIIMRSPEGNDYIFKGNYIEIVEPQRLVYTNNLDEHPAEWHEMVNKNRPNAKGNIKGMITTVTLEESQGKTQQTIRMGFESVEDRDALVKLGMAEGWSGSFNKLEKLMAKV